MQNIQLWAVKDYGIKVPVLCDDDDTIEEVVNNVDRCFMNFCGDLFTRNRELVMTINQDDNRFNHAAKHISRMWM